MLLTREEVIKKGWDKAETVVIPNGVIGIGEGAFEGCNSLVTITVPDSVTSIGRAAFENCHSLTNVTIPNSVTSIGAYAFGRCYSLISITIPKGVTSIRSYVFTRCSSLTNVTIPNSITSIGIGAFDGCCSLTNFTIPNSVTSIGIGAFDGCSNLTNVTIPDGVTSIRENVFCGCRSLTNFTIPNGVTSIGNGAFENCHSLTSVTIPNSVTSIGDYAFSNCNCLTSVTIPEGVTNIGNDAFRYCHNLTNLTIPDSVTSIGNDAFWDCYNCDINMRKKTYRYISADLNALSRNKIIKGCGLKEWVELSSDMLELGIHPFYEKDWAEPSAEEITKLSETFKAKFGRAPKVINEIALAQKIFNLATEDIVNNFSVEGFKKALQKSNNNAFIAIVALLGAGKDLLHKFPVATSYDMGLASSNIRNWIRKHPDSFELLPRLKGMETDINEDMSVSEVKELLVTKKARNDLKKIEGAYDFIFTDCKCEIEQTEVKLEHLTAHLLAPSDLRQITVGYDTYCCQHYGSAGETAMMYGLMSATAGFWAIEDSKGAIKAQAEVWLTEDKSTFVFDNIEFANDRDVSDYEDIIKAWTEACPYPNVILGMGYTEIDLPCPRCEQPDQPMCGELGEEPYTDTHSCVCLKKDGELTW